MIFHFTKFIHFTLKNIALYFLQLLSSSTTSKLFEINEKIIRFISSSATFYEGKISFCFTIQYKNEKNALE
jgi:hypothetical protein